MTDFLRWDNGTWVDLGEGMRTERRRKPKLIETKQGGAGVLVDPLVSSVIAIAAV